MRSDPIIARFLSQHVRTLREVRQDLVDDAVELGALVPGGDAEGDFVEAERLVAFEFGDDVFDGAE
jgi:hypothetical protein